MLYLLINFIATVVVPYAQAVVSAALPGVMELIITVVAIALICSAVGIRLHIGGAVATAMYAIVRWTAYRMVDLVRWLVRTVTRLVRWTYGTSLGIYARHTSQGIATLLAVLTAVAVLAVII